MEVHDVIVDTHAHVIPPGILEEWRAGRWPFESIVVEETDAGRFIFHFPKPDHLGPARPAIPGLLDIETQVGRMDEQDIDAVAVSPWVDVMGYWLPPEQGAAWSRFHNEQMLQMGRDHPRLIPLGTVPLQDGELAAREVRVAREMGLKGLQIGTVAGDKELDDESLRPFWRAVADHDMGVFLHPMYHGGDERMLDGLPYGLANSVGRIVDTTVTVTRLLFAGVLTEVPGVKLLVAHGGAAIPYILGRLQRSYKLASSEIADVRAGFECLFFDTVVFDPEALRYLLDVAGHERVLLGSDHPFPNGDPEPMKVIDAAIVDPTIRQRIVEGNPRHVFGIES